jgi:hypothetical protein
MQPKNDKNVQSQASINTRPVQLSITGIPILIEEPGFSDNKKNGSVTKITSVTKFNGYNIACWGRGTVNSANYKASASFC